MADFETNLIGDIYEAAIIPEKWPSVLSSLTELTDGAFASIIAVHNGKIANVGTPLAERVIADFVALNKPDFNSRLAPRLAHPDPDFITDLDVFTSDQIAADPFYQDFLYPRGGGWVAATCVLPPTGEMMSVSIERAKARGPFESDFIAKLNVFAPHLARASLLAARLGFERAKATTDILETLGLPAAVLREHGKLVTCNRLMQNFIPSLLTDRRDRVYFQNQSADKLLENAIAQWPRRRDAVTINSMAVPASSEYPAIVFHLVPIVSSASDILNAASFVLLATPVDRRIPSANVIAGLFDLSGAEARIARAIASGQTIEEIAFKNGVARETVRKQMRAILAKTGQSRQAGLASLLGGLTFAVTSGAETNGD